MDQRGLIIVGQAPASPAHEHQLAFSGTPSGGRLARLAGYETVTQLASRGVGLVNLLPQYPGRQRSGKGDLFPVKEARARAASMMWRLRPGASLVLCGAVAQAFGLRRPKPLEWVFLAAEAQVTPATPVEFEGQNTHAGPEYHLYEIRQVAYLPHPSGVNRWWNDPENSHAAMMFLRNAVATCVDGLGPVGGIRLAGGS